MENLSVDDWIAIIGGVVALASAIAAATPTDSDNRIVAAVIRALDAFALNWGKRNPRKVEGEAAKRRRMSGPVPALLLALPLLGACTTAQVQQVADRVALTCYTLDGEAVTHLVDVLADDIGVTAETVAARAWRQAMCAMLLPPQTAPLPAPRP